MEAVERSSSADQAASKGRAVRGRGRIPPFQSFLDEHRDVVYRFLLAAVGHNEADDCFQETFLAALRAYPSLRNADNLRGWILAIATRKAIDAARGRKRRPEPVSDVAELAEPTYWDPVLDESLWDDVRALPPRQRVALVHRILLDRPYSELAAAMGGSMDAARANVYQALKKLKEAWKSREED